MTVSTNWPGYLAPEATIAPFVIDAGVLTIGGTAVGNIHAPSRGGMTFDPGREEREIPADGIGTPIVGNHRVIKYDSRIKGKFLGSKGLQIMKYMPGATSDGSSDNTITPIAARQLYASGDYLTSVYLIGNRVDGKLVRILFAKALVVKWSVAAADNNEWEHDIEIQAVNPAATPNICPFVVQEAA